MADTPEEFARKLARLPQAVHGSSERGTRARAKVTRDYILASALERNRGTRPSWVQVRVNGDTAEVRLRGGFAYLTEKGSYKKPDGWEEGPKTVTARRIRNAKKRGVTLEQHHAVLTPEGPRAHVHHKPLRARPFWKRGLEASRKPAARAYQREIDQAITRTLR